MYPFHNEFATEFFDAFAGMSAQGSGVQIGDEI